MISVIVTAYNLEKYITRCMNSVLQQSYKNIEVIAVDDGSTDSTGNILNQYKTIDSRVNVIQKDNGGVVSARNAGLSKAIGDWIVFVDGDDWVEQDYLRKMVTLAENVGCDIVCCGYKEVYSDYTVERGYKEDSICDNFQAQRKLASYEINDFITVKLYRKRIWEGIMCPQLSCAEDMAVMYQLFAKAEKVGIIAECLTYYYQRNDSIVHTFNINKIKDVFVAYSKRFEYYDSLFPDITRNQRKELVKLAYNVCCNKDDEKIDDVYIKALEAIKKYRVWPDDLTVRSILKLFIFRYLK